MDHTLRTPALDWIINLKKAGRLSYKGVLRGWCKEPSPLSHLNYKISEKDVCRYTPNDSGSEEKVCFVLGGQRSDKHLKTSCGEAWAEKDEVSQEGAQPVHLRQ